MKSIGQQILEGYISSLDRNEEIKTNYRPEWLDNLEIDIYIRKK